MDSERTEGKLKIALACYDRRELRVQKNYLEEQNATIGCSCFRNGNELLQQLRQGVRYDVVVLYSQLEDMGGIEFVMELRKLDNRPLLMLFDEGKRRNRYALQADDNTCRFVERSELRQLLRELYRLPGQQGQQLEQQCQKLYLEWGMQPADINCGYLTSAVGIVSATSQKLAIRKEILQAVGEQYNVSVSAVDSGIRRMIDQLEAEPTAAWTAFKERSGFADEKPSTGKLIYAVKNYFLWRRSVE